MDSYWVTNANVSYTLRTGPFKGLRVRVGANNVFNEAPPFYPASTAGYDSYYADPRGRMTYVDLDYKF
jgi:outer membrane receptor protein involved in Fe transport